MCLYIKDLLPKGKVHNAVPCKKILSIRQRSIFHNNNWNTKIVTLESPFRYHQVYLDKPIKPKAKLRNSLNHYYTNFNNAIVNNGFIHAYMDPSFLEDKELEFDCLAYGVKAYGSSTYFLSKDEKVDSLVCSKLVLNEPIDYMLYRIKGKCDQLGFEFKREYFLINP